MNCALEISPTVDTLRFRVHSHVTVPQHDLRINVAVTALVKSHDAETEQIHQRIRETLNSFIEAQWVLSRIRREADATDYERLQLHATARVPVTENYNIEERARNAGGEGLTLSSPAVDYSLPADRVSQVTQQLREQVLLDVLQQVEACRRITSRDWRLGDIEFGVESRSNLAHARTSEKGAYRDELSDQIFIDDEGAGLTGAERIVLLANVTLKAPPG